MATPMLAGLLKVAATDPKLKGLVANVGQDLHITGIDQARPWALGTLAHHAPVLAVAATSREAEDLTAVDVERDVVQGGEAADGPDPGVRHEARAPVALHDRVGQGEERRPHMPQGPEPGRGARPRADDPSRSEQAREAEELNRDDECREQAAGGENQQRHRPGAPVLREEKAGCDRVDRDQRGLVARDESRHRAHRLRHDGQEGERQKPEGGGDRNRESPLRGGRPGIRQGREAWRASAVRHDVAPGRAPTARRSGAGTFWYSS